MKNVFFVAGFVLLVLLVATIARPDLNADIIAYYPFNGNANDASGNGHDGVVNGATPAQDRHGRTNSALSFDGDDFVDIWSTQQMNVNIDTTQGSISVWFKLDNRTQGVSSFVFQYFSDNDDRLYIDAGDRNIPDGKIRFGLGNTHRLSNAIIEVGRWYHVVTTWDVDGSTKIYIDGQLDSEGSFGNPGFVFHDSERFYFGQGWNGNVGTYEGLIDDIHIFNRSLTEDEIGQIYLVFRDGFESGDTFFWSDTTSP